MKKLLLLIALLTFSGQIQAAKWTDYSFDTVPAPADEVMGVDVSDTSMSSSGTHKRIVIRDLKRRIIVTKTANYTTSSDDDVILADASGGDVVITRHTASGNLGRELQVIKTDTSAYTVTIGSVILRDQNHGTTFISNNTTWVKSQETAQAIVFGDMFVHDNSTATVVNTQDIPHLIQGLFSEVYSQGLTFAAGSTGVITEFADATGGQVTVTSATHGLSNGASLSISGTTSYNGVFLAANVTTNTYEITDTWVADDATGGWYEGDSYTVDANSAGMYQVSFHGFGVSGGNNKTFEFELYINTSPQENVESKRTFTTSDTGAVGGSGLAMLSEGDIITFGLIGLTDTTNFTVEHLNLTLHRL